MLILRLFFFNLDKGESTSISNSDDQPRRSTRLRNTSGSSTSSGRVSLLPTTTVSPVTPKEDLMCFE